MRLIPVLALLLLIPAVVLSKPAEAAPPEPFDFVLRPIFPTGHPGGWFSATLVLGDYSTTRFNVTTFVSLNYTGIESSRQNMEITPSNTYGLVADIYIPSSIPLGNYALTAEAIYQYFDNNTRVWITPANNTISETRTFTITDLPAGSFVSDVFLPQALPVAVGSLVAALAPLPLALRTARRTRLGKMPDGQDDMSKDRLRFQILGSVWVPVCLIFVALVEPAFVQPIGLALTIGWLLALTGLAFAALIGTHRGNKRAAALISLLLVGFSMTLLSAPLSQQISETHTGTVLEAGFPLHWYYQTLVQNGFSCGPPFLCPLYHFPPTTTPFTSIALDGLFYSLLATILLAVYCNRNRLFKRRG